jgi:6-pyruvoyltetrahydropterin/6-carboxytetrahydropterin synthase
MSRIRKPAGSSISPWSPRRWALRERLDHHLLNEIDGLALPTPERLAAWIWRELRPSLPGLVRVTVRRQSEGESCTYRGEG